MFSCAYIPLQKASTDFYKNGTRGGWRKRNQRGGYKTRNEHVASSRGAFLPSCLHRTPLGIQAMTQFILFTPSVGLFSPQRAQGPHEENMSKNQLHYQAPNHPQNERELEETNDVLGTVCVAERGTKLPQTCRTRWKNEV